MHRKYFIILYFLLLSVIGYSQDYLFNIRHFTVENGMLGRKVNSILQDKEGFIWIATDEGLNRFDGHQFEHFTKESHGLYSNEIASMQIDRVGDIWLNYIQNEYNQLEVQIFKPQSRKPISLKEKLGENYSTNFKNLRLKFPYTNYIRLISKEKKVYQYQEKVGLQLIKEESNFKNPYNGNIWLFNKEKTKLTEQNKEGSTINVLELPNYKSINVGFFEKKQTAIFVTSDNKKRFFCKIRMVFQKYHMNIKIAQEYFLMVLR